MKCPFKKIKTITVDSLGTKVIGESFSSCDGQECMAYYETETRKPREDKMYDVIIKGYCRLTDEYQ